LVLVVLVVLKDITELLVNHQVLVLFLSQAVVGMALM
jgi:hypothetical protein